MLRDYKDTLQELIDRKGISLGKLAAECSELGQDTTISKGYLSKILKGENDPPRRPELNMALGKVLGYSGHALQLAAEAHHINKNFPETKALFAAATTWLFQTHVGIIVESEGSPADRELLPGLEATIGLLKEVGGRDTQDARKLQQALDQLREVRGRVWHRQGPDEDRLAPVRPAIKLLADLFGVDIDKWDVNALGEAMAHPVWDDPDYRATVLKQFEARKAEMESAGEEIKAAQSLPPTLDDIVTAIERYTGGSRLDISTFITPVIKALDLRMAGERNREVLASSWGIDHEELKPGYGSITRSMTKDGPKVSRGAKEE